ncbi:MAG: DNA-binding response regulator [Sphingobacteriia bacterium]|nr:MAG: DNA-binding response regulator [Sphingobacteriia bacterium]
MTKVAIVDDHALLRIGLRNTVNRFAGYQVMLEAENGLDLKTQMSQGLLPEIILLDLSMPVMDGYQTADWLSQEYPDVKIMVLSMHTDEQSIIRMVYLGVKAYLPKEAKPDELESALNSLKEKGFFFNELYYVHFRKQLSNKKTDALNELETLLHLNDRERQFLKWMCTEKPMKEIAAEMNLSPRTLDGYRDNLFLKIGTHSRVGLIMFALRNHLVHLHRNSPPA